MSKDNEELKEIMFMVSVDKLVEAFAYDEEMKFNFVGIDLDDWRIDEALVVGFMPNPGYENGFVTFHFKLKNPRMEEYYEEAIAEERVFQRRVREVGMEQAKLEEEKKYTADEIADKLGVE